jgi:hypothetical protein
MKLHQRQQDPVNGACLLTRDANQQDVLPTFKHQHWTFSSSAESNNDSMLSLNPFCLNVQVSYHMAMDIAAVRTV